MADTTNSISTQLDSLNRMYINALKLLEAFSGAMKSEQKDVTVELTDANNNLRTYTLPSNFFLSSEITRLEGTISNITQKGGTFYDKDNNTYIELVINNLKEFEERIFFTDVTINDYIAVRTNRFLETLTNPTLNIGIELNEKFNNIRLLRVLQYNVNDLITVSSGITYNAFLQLLNSTQENIDKYEYTVNVEGIENRYYGKFDVLSIRNVDNSATFELQLSKVTFSDTQSVFQDTMALIITDEIVTNNGSAVFEVLNVDSINNKIQAKRTKGVGIINVGIGTIEYKQKVTTKPFILIPTNVGITKYLLFLQPFNDKYNTISSFGSGILVDVATKYVIDSVTGLEYSYAEYLSNFVDGIGSKLNAVLQDVGIPATKGIIPNTPILLQKYFAVKQINTHVTQRGSLEQINKLVSQKNVIKNEINALNNQLYTINTRIVEGNYTTGAERNTDIQKYENVSKTLNKQSILLSNIVKNINEIVNITGVSKAEPKYKIIGFWPVQDDIISTETEKQKIVQYEIRYKYKPVDNSDASVISISYESDDNRNVTGVKSNWNYEYTNALERVLNANGKFVWGDNNITNSEQKNINECSISINAGESVEIQVRAVSEAGFPLNAVKSAWSNSIILEFPESLSDIDPIKQIIEQNSGDSINIEITKTLRSEGILQHVQGSFTENNTYFAHTAAQIFSGMRSAEQSPISMFEKMLKLEEEINFIRSTIERRSAVLSIDVLDENLRSQQVSNNINLNIFAGYYTQNVDLINVSNYGNIVEKTFYLRILNSSAITAEILSLSHGNLSINTENSNYNYSTLRIASKDSVKERQYNGQIVYIRNKDVSGNTDIYVTDDGEQNTVALVEDVDNSVTESEKNVIEYNGTDITTLRLKDSIMAPNSYGLIAKIHPYFTDSVKIKEEFERLKRYTQTTNIDNVQKAYNSEASVAFFVNDKYFVGKNSMGAKLFVDINDITNLQVSGVDSNSIYLLNSGSSNAIIIPIKFQYRLTDFLGFTVSGTKDFTTNYTIKKRIGFDILKGINDTMRFDITFSAKFRPDTVIEEGNTQFINKLIETGSTTTPKIV